MEQKIYHYPVWLRIWHLINALLCLSLIVTGINMQYLDSKNVLFSFDMAVSIHNFSGIALSLNYLFFFLGNVFTRNFRFYKIDRKTIFSQFKLQMAYYLGGIFKNAKSPFPVSQERKFNPIQQISYVVIMYIFVPLVFITGWALLFPEVVIRQIFGVSGLLLTDLLHITVGFTISLFLLIHIYFCTTGSRISSAFKSMINGWAEVH